MYCLATVAMHLPHVRLLLSCSEFKRREKAARVAKEREEKKASRIQASVLSLPCSSLICLLRMQLVTSHANPNDWLPCAGGSSCSQASEARRPAAGST